MCCTNSTQICLSYYKIYCGSMLKACKANGAHLTVLSVDPDTIVLPYELRPRWSQNQHVQLVCSCTCLSRGPTTCEARASHLTSTQEESKLNQHAGRTRFRHQIRPNLFPYHEVHRCLVSSCGELQIRASTLDLVLGDHMRRA